MKMETMIAKLRTGKNLTQSQFAELLGVSRQSVQKWESGATAPELDKLVRIAKYFDVSLDALVLGSNARIADDLNYDKAIKPRYANLHEWESYSSALAYEYRQCCEEGLDVREYENIFNAVSALPQNEVKKKLSDILFQVVLNAKQVDGYQYNEPSDIDRIRALRPLSPALPPVNPDTLKQKIHGAWMGRICGCLLGKTVEGIKTDELIPFLKESGNYPMHRYILRSDLKDDTPEKYRFRFLNSKYADTENGMPPDDDTNYVVLAQELVDKYGRDFTPYDVSRIWMSLQPKDAYCTAERVAFCNFIQGIEPPDSAVFQNPYREWIGAQIRGDYFGYINPGQPELAADMAFRDACISHVKNGIYGEMFVSAMLAAAAATSDIRTIISAGLAQIPATSRLYEAVTGIMQQFDAGATRQDCFAAIHARYDEYDGHDWCHTISNALIVTASLLYGRGDFGRSICMAVESASTPTATVPQWAPSWAWPTASAVSPPSGLIPFRTPCTPAFSRRKSSASQSV